MQAAVPVLVTEEGRPLTGENIFHHLQSITSPSQSAARVFPSDVIKFCKKLDEVNIGVLTYGLAFHTKHTKLLRFPYCKEDFFEKVIVKKVQTQQSALVERLKFISHFSPVITF